MKIGDVLSYFMWQKLTDIVQKSGAVIGITNKTTSVAPHRHGSLFLDSGTRLDKAAIATETVFNMIVIITWL